MNNELWTKDKAKIAKFRGVKESTITRYVNDKGGNNGGLIFETDEQGTIWYFLGDKTAHSLASAKRIRDAKDSPLKREQKLSITKFVTLFKKETGLSQKKIMEYIEKGIIESELDGDERYITYWDRTRTLNQIEKNREAHAKKIAEDIQEEEEEDINNNVEDLPAGYPVKPSLWADGTSYGVKLYQKLLTALNNGVFDGISPELFYTENFGDKSKSSWDIEYPTRELAEEIGRMIMRGARNPKKLQIAIVNLLHKEGYKSGKGIVKKTNPQEAAQKKSPSVGDYVKREEYDSLKNDFAKFKQFIKKEFIGLSNTVGQNKASLTGLKDTVRHLNSKGKTDTVPAPVGDGWDNI